MVVTFICRIDDSVGIIIRAGQVLIPPSMPPYHNWLDIPHIYYHINMQRAKRKYRRRRRSKSSSSSSSRSTYSSSSSYDRLYRSSATPPKQIRLELLKGSVQQQLIAGKRAREKKMKKNAKESTIPWSDLLRHIAK